MAETQLRKALAISQGDLSALVTSPFAAIAYLSLVAFLVLGLFLKRRQEQMEREPVDAQEVSAP